MSGQMIERDTVVRRNPKAVFRKLADGAGAVLLDLDSAEYFGVNDLGALIWSRLDDDMAFGALVDAIRSEVDDPPADLESDVAEFLEALHQRDLVVLEPGPSPGG